MRYDALLTKESTVTRVNLKQKLFWIGSFAILFGFWQFVYVNWTPLTRLSNARLFSIKDNWPENYHVEQKLRHFTIKQPGCRIPPMSLLGPSIDPYIYKSSRTYCEFRQATKNEYKWEPPFVLDSLDTLYINTSLLKLHGERRRANCTYVAFRLSSTDYRRIDNYRIRFSKTVKIIPQKGSITVDSESDEFVQVNCSVSRFSGDSQQDNYSDYFAFVPTKKSVEKRCDEFAKISNTSSVNTIVIGLDALSRLNFHRQMPRSASFLLKQMNAVEMLGYNKIGDNTFPNLIPLLTNLTVDELKKKCWSSESKDVFDKCPFIWKTMERFGYRTVYAEDCPQISTFNYFKKGFRRQPTDYYTRPFYVHTERSIGAKKPGNCVLCYGSKLSLRVLLDYSLKHMRKFRDKKLFGFFWSNSFTHDYFNLGPDGDEIVFRLLRTLHDENLLNNTALFIISDHGLRWGNFRNTYQGRLEERLPLLMVVLPTWFRRRFANAVENLRQNADRLTTHFDLHHTLLDLANISSLENAELQRRFGDVIGTRGHSLFIRVSPNRTCAEAAIPKHYCTCHDNIRELNTTDTKVVEAAAALMRYVDGLLQDHPECAKLRLESIERAAVETATMGGKFTSEESGNYMITVKTYPGMGLFEGTVRYEKATNSFETSGHISRINAYGAQSFCVKDYHLKLFCYCRS